MGITHGDGASPGPSAIKPTHTNVVSSSSSFMNADSPSGSGSYRGVNETTYTDDATMATPPNVPAPLPTIADGAGSKDTPVKAKSLMDGYTHHGAAVTKDSVLGYAQMAAVNGFEDYYLREAKAIQTAEWGQYKADFLSNLQEATSEKQMYSPLVKLLTKVSLLVCKDKDRCLAFHDTSSRGCSYDFEGSELRPDIVARWTTHANATRMVRENKKEPEVYWYEIQSLVEVKQNFGSLPPSNQAGQYLHVLPRGIPSLAGMLYLALDKFRFYIYWSDTSGIVRSHQYDIAEDKSWDVLFRYVLTVVEPLENLPTWDPTMTIHVENPSKPEWVISSNKKAHLASQLYSMNGHSRQTIVFWSEARKRIIKDQWRDNDRRFNESEILERIKGVPGVAQVDFSEVVKGSDDEPLTTSALHSGAECVLEFEYKRRVPKRTKQRNVLKTKGDSLSKRTSVLQVVMALFDSVQGHQICVNEKEVMHRDVSENNIVINPVHYDAKLDDMPKAKYINQILNPKAGQLKEEGALIDWDNAAFLDEGIVGDALTDRTGTPMFVSISVGTGRIRNGNRFRGRFPRLEGEAKQLYIQAFGQEKYDEYIEAVEKSAKYTDPEEDAPPYKHSPFHDIESFFWVLVYELLLAWPEGEEECMTQNASSLILQFRAHSFVEDGADFRTDVLSKTKDFFISTLHPRLWCLAGILARMAAYLLPEWSFWPGLPKDHVHEAFKRLLFAAACILKSNPIPLRAEKRNPKQSPDAMRHSSHCENKESASPTKSGSKRSYVHMGSAQEELLSKRTKGESTLREAGGSDSRPSANIEGKTLPPSLPAISGNGRGRRATTEKQGMMLPPPAPEAAEHRPSNDEGGSRRSSAKGKGRMPFPTPSESGQNQLTGGGSGEQASVLRRSARLRTKSTDS